MTVQQPPKFLSATIANNAAVSGVIDMRDFIGGIVIVDNSWSAANMGFKVCNTSDGTFVAVKDKDGTPLQIASITTDTSFAYCIPTELFPAMFVKLWSKSTTAATVTDVNQSGDAVVVVMLK